MELNDHANKGFKVYRDETPQVKDDRKAINHGFKVTEQDDIAGEYTFIDGGGESGWGYWKIEGIGKSIEKKENSRDGEIYDYMKNNDILSDEYHLEGIWSQALPAVIVPNGVVPIDKQKKSNLQTKEINNNPESYNNDIIQHILGYTTPCGVPGIVVTSSSQDGEIQYFVPSGGILSSDNEFGGMSSRIVNVAFDGYMKNVATLDSVIEVIKNEEGIPVAAIKGDKSQFDFTGWGGITLKYNGTKFLCYLSCEKGGILHPGCQNDKHKIGESEDAIISPVHIDVNANFYMDEIKDGALDIEDSIAPATIEPEADFFAKVHCKWSNARNKWVWYVGMSTGTETMICARIRWNIDIEEDLSEAEIVEKIDGVWQATGSLVWIDSQRSLSTDFSTGGDNTIFRLKLVEKEITRQGEIRDLYYASYCLEDFGNKISHFSTSIYQNSKIRGVLLSEEKQDPVWENVGVSLIETTIKNELKTNGIIANIPKQWEPQSQDFQYLEISGLAKGLHTLFRPIEPVPEDPINMPKIYRSFIEQNEEPIAWYEVK